MLVRKARSDATELRACLATHCNTAVRFRHRTDSQLRRNHVQIVDTMQTVQPLLTTKPPATAAWNCAAEGHQAGLSLIEHQQPTSRTTQKEQSTRLSCPSRTSSRATRISRSPAASTHQERPHRPRRRRFATTPRQVGPGDQTQNHELRHRSGNCLARLKGLGHVGDLSAHGTASWPSGPSRLAEDLHRASGGAQPSSGCPRKCSYQRRGPHQWVSPGFRWATQKDTHQTAAIPSRLTVRPFNRSTGFSLQGSATESREAKSAPIAAHTTVEVGTRFPRWLPHCRSRGNA